MPHWISLAATYLAIAGAYILIIRLGKKCTTTRQEDSPVKTEPSPTGQTPSTSPQLARTLANVYRNETYGKFPHAGSHRPVSGFYSARSTDGGHSNEM